MRMTQNVQHIAEYRGVEVLGDGAKQLDFRLHSWVSLTGKSLTIGVFQKPCQREHHRLRNSTPPCNSQVFRV